jgi:DNA-binding response OmpR family regulator
VITREQPELVFLDMQMTTLHGLEVARAIEGSTAVVFVTAFGEYALRAFDVSAVDYLLKPFDETRFEQALARARAHVESARTRDAHARLLERVQEMEADGVTPRRRSVIRVADIEIDLGAYEVRRGGALVALRPKLVDLLAALARRAGEVLTRQELLQAVWGYQSDVVSRTLDTHMVTLRQRLGHLRDEPGYIETVLKVGYRMRV